MDVELQVGDLYAAFVQRALSVFEQFPIDRPVVGGLAPHAHRDHQCAVAALCELYEGRGLAEYVPYCCMTSEMPLRSIWMPPEMSLLSGFFRYPQYFASIILY